MEHLAMKCVPAKVDTVGSMQRSLRNTVHESAVAYGIGAQFSHERRMGPGDQHANSAVTWGRCSSLMATNDLIESCWQCIFPFFANFSTASRL